MTSFPVQAIYHTFLNVTVADKVEALIVPQKVYGSAAQFTPNETIQFSHNGQSGIRMVSALDSCNGLDGETVISPIVTMGTKVSLRVNVRQIIFISLHLFTNDSIFFVVAWMSAMERISRCCSCAGWTPCNYHEGQARSCRC